MVAKKEANSHLDLLSRKKGTKWHAVITRYRNEKAVANYLSARGLQSYVPLQKIVKQYASRKKTNFIPLINCHVFVRIESKDQGEVLNTPGVLSFIKFSDKIAIIPDREMEILELVCSGQYPFKVESEQVAEGDFVEVISGKLSGIKGRLTKANNANRFVVHFENIDHSISIEIDAKHLQKIR